MTQGSSRLCVADFRRKRIIQQYFRGDFFGEANLSTDPFLQSRSAKAPELWKERFCGNPQKRSRCSADRFVRIKTNRSAAKPRLKSPVFPAKSQSVRLSACVRISVRIRERGDSGRLWRERSSATGGGAVWTIVSQAQNGRNQGYFPYSS